MRINTNIAALNTQRILTQTDASAAKEIGRLSSGFRINNASDDAAGLAISNKLNATVRSLQQASRNADQANSMLQIMQGGASQIESILERMKELATQSNSDTVDSSSRAQLNNEFGKLQSEIDRITNTTKFNGNTLIDGNFGTSLDATATSDAYGAALVSDVAINGAAAGTYTLTDNGDGTFALDNGSGVVQTVDSGVGGNASAAGVELNFDKLGLTLTMGAYTTANGTAAVVGTAGHIHVQATTTASFMVSSSGGANYSAANNTGDLLSMSAVNLKADHLNVDSSSIDVSTASNAQAALTAIDTALNDVNTSLGTIGALQNRIGFASANTASLVQNTQAAVSTIKDADMAKEMTEFSRLQILQQAGTAMLAQANQAPQQVLRLFQ